MRQEEGDEIIDSGSAHIGAFSPRNPLHDRCYSRGTNMVYACICAYGYGCRNGRTEGEGSTYAPRLMMGNRRGAGEGVNRCAKGSSR